MRWFGVLLFGLTVSATALGESPSPPPLSLEQARAIAKAELARRKMADKPLTVRLLSPREREPFYLVEFDSQKSPTVEELQRSPSLVQALKNGPKEFVVFKISMDGQFSQCVQKIEIRSVGYQERMASASSAPMTRGLPYDLFVPTKPADLSSAFWEKPISLSLKQRQASDR